MYENPGKTAIARKTLSQPMKLLAEQGLLIGRVLDYGCGRGFDADHLGLHKYDPNQEWNKLPRGKFDTITCNYVLNVVSKKTGDEIIADIKSRLRKGGVAYVSVRRDIKKNTKSQRVVKLKLPVVKENGSFCMYRVENDQ